MGCNSFQSNRLMNGICPPVHEYRMVRRVEIQDKQTAYMCLSCAVASSMVLCILCFEMGWWEAVVCSNSAIPEAGKS